MQIKYSIQAVLFSTLILSGCLIKSDKLDNKSNSAMDIPISFEMNVLKKPFGVMEDGKEVTGFILNSGSGIEVEIIEYGAIIKNIRVPDRNGEIADVVLGYDNLAGYQKDPYYFGATIGRVANRIGGAEFHIDSKEYHLAPNTLPDFGKNHLHGGIKGFNKVLWEGEDFHTEEEVGVRLTYLSEDGEEGYPGNLKCTVQYTLNRNNELAIQFFASTDQVTLVNFTHHSYFNLAGAGSGTILNHLVMINADSYTPADDDLIPTGEISSVVGLPVDFREADRVGNRLENMQQSKFTGFDLNYIINREKEGGLALAAKYRHPESGRSMEVYTTQPCMHFYTSNFLTGEQGKGGLPYNQYGALCFEPQGFPDAPHHEKFLPVKIEPGENYKQKITYVFFSHEK